MHTLHLRAHTVHIRSPGLPGRNNTLFCAHGWFYVFFSKSRYATTALLLRLILYCCHQCPTATYSFNLEASTPSQIPCAQAKTVFLQEASPCPWRRVVRQRTQCLRTCSTHHIMFFGEMLKRSENVFLFFRDMLRRSENVFLFFRDMLRRSKIVFLLFLDMLKYSQNVFLFFRDMLRRSENAFLIVSTFIQNFLVVPNFFSYSYVVFLHSLLFHFFRTMQSSTVFPSFFCLFSIIFSTSRF